MPLTRSGGHTADWRTCSEPATGNQAVNVNFETCSVPHTSDASMTKLSSSYPAFLALALIGTPSRSLMSQEPASWSANLEFNTFSIAAVDPGQVGVIAIDGRSALHTGARAVAWAGHRAGPNYVKLLDVTAVRR